MAFVMRLRRQRQLEYAARGAFLGGVLAVLAAGFEPRQVAGALAWPVGLLAVSMAVLAVRAGGRGGWTTRLLFVAMQSTVVIYATVLGGFVVGLAEAPWLLKASCFGFGIVAWTILGEVLEWQPRKKRLIATVCWIALCTAVLAIEWYRGVLPLTSDPLAWAGVMMTAAALWYVLLLAGRTEESELEIGLMCAALGAAFASLPLPVFGRALAFMLPVALYVIYCERIRLRAVAFKMALRGLCAEHAGDLRGALIEYRRSLAAAPSQLAVAGNWRVHRAIDVTRLRDDPDLSALIDSRACLERARGVLDRAAASGKELVEAHHLLQLVEERRPDLPWTLARERLRLLLANGQIADAGVYLDRLLPVEIDETQALPDHEAEAVFRIWSTALSAPGLAAAGVKRLETPTALFAFLASLERRRAQWPDDPEANGYRPFAYERVTWRDFDATVARRPGDPLPWLGYDFCLTLGLDAANAKPPRYERARDMLRVAGWGFPERRFDAYRVLAEIDDAEAGKTATEWREKILDLGLAFGPRQLPARDREVFDDAVRRLGELALANGRSAQAIAKFELLLDSPKAGVGTLRTLQRLYEEIGDDLGAIRTVEAVLSYGLDAKERQHWLGEKRRLYARLDPSAIRERVAGKRWFDADFCFQEAHRLFDGRAPDDELDRWLKLAALAGPERTNALAYMHGRLARRRGDHAAAVALLTQVADGGKDKLALPEADRRFHDACRTLADLHVELGDDLGRAYELYRKLEKWSGSGADTLFKLGEVCEKLGRRPEARKWYDMVTVYSDHPRAADARAAVARLSEAAREPTA